ncbi:O-antigen ligase family protein [Acidicapsa dinghuensis]|uniref:O-antigen ligase family protein n=1 Tax=Acidicapsa dinghuensis TaxID=2218256 RepID=A0ABW1EKW7_9BACT|nr:O-antigen ligase family protein [Acidicapsa dinghuensis]
MRRLPLLLLMLYVFAVPWEYSLDVGEPLGNAARIVGMALLAVVVPLVLRHGGPRRLGALQWCVLALYLFFACSYFWTVDGDATAEKIRAYAQVMMAVWLIWEVAKTPEDLHGLMRAWVAGCWVLAGLTMLSYFTMGAAAGQVRFAAEGQDPNDVARFLDFGFAIATLEFATEQRWWLRVMAMAYIPVGLLAVLLTASRGGFAGAFVAMVGVAALLVMWRPQAAAGVFGGLAVTVTALWLYVPAGTLERLATITTEVQGGDWNDRTSLWAAGLRAFERAPWLGYGAGTFASASHLTATDTAHNTLLAVLVTGGLIGLALFMCVLVSVAVSIVRTQGLMRVALVTTFAVWMITSMVGSVEENRATWVLFGMMALAGRLTRESPKAMRLCFDTEAKQSQKRRGLAAAWHGSVG